jgi:hypothetical protein
MVGSLYRDNDQFPLIPGGGASGCVSGPLAKVEERGVGEGGRDREALGTWEDRVCEEATGRDDVPLLGSGRRAASLSASVSGSAAF